jgi:hypothetical protein
LRRSRLTPGLRFTISWRLMLRLVITSFSDSPLRTGYTRYTLPMPSRISLSRLDSFPAGSRMVCPSLTLSGSMSGFMLSTCCTVKPAGGARGLW